MERKMKIAYCGYDFFYKCLDFLVENNFEVIKIFTFETDNIYNFNDNITNIAENNNIPIQTSKITEEDINLLIKQGCDLIISAAYSYKIPINPKLKGVNIHPTLLPEGKGMWPLPYIILNENKTSGVTIHKLTEKLDSGDILVQKEFPLFDEEDLETLSMKTQIIAVEILSKLLQNFDFYWRNAIKQEIGSYWNMPTEEEMTLDWNLDVKTLKKICRAFGKMDSCAIFDNTHWVVQDINGWVEKHNYKNGTVVHRTNKEVLVAVKDGFICVRCYKKDIDYE